jgi:ABC-type dipeptide/oligopeptide/nickel transport system permease subunit
LLALAFAFLLPFLAPDGLQNALLGPQQQNPAAIEHVRSDEHLGTVAPVRYVRFVVDALHGDLGRSYVQDVDVEREVFTHTWLTALLVLAVVFAWRRAGPSVVFGVLAVEAVLRWPGVGRVFADAVDVRDVVTMRAVLAVVLVGCVFLPPARSNGVRSWRPARTWTTAAWAWLFAVALVLAFAHRLPLADPAALYRWRAAPSLHHWLGTDDVGRDVLARVVWGAQGTVLLAAVATAAGFVVGMIVGALVAENPRAARGITRLGRIGIPAIAFSVALAAMGTRSATVYWEWLLPVTIGPAIVWGATGVMRAQDGAAALLDGAANAVAAVAVLGALGLVPRGTLTLGTLLDDVRGADHRVWTPLIATIAVLVLSIAALRLAAASLRSSRNRGDAVSGAAAPARAGR